MAHYSIILPVRNGGSYVKECVQSVLAQTYPHFSFLILDNNSSDGTSEYLRGLKDPRVNVFYAEKDLTMPQNWARALQLETHEFITFIGHDDILYPHFLEEMYRLIQADPQASIYQSHFNYIDASGRLLRKCKPMPAKMLAADFLKAQFLQTMDSMGTGYVFRAKDFKQLHGFSTEYPNLIFSDYRLLTELTGITYLRISPETCFGYRLHQNLSLSTQAEKYRVAFEKYVYFLHDYKQSRPDVQEVIKEYAGDFLMYFCESLSHRLLKSPSKEQRISVHDFIDKCEAYARLLEVNQPFRPRKKKRIWLAEAFDRNNFTRNIFKTVRPLFTK